MSSSNGLRVSILRDARLAVGSYQHWYGRDPESSLPLCSHCNRPLDLVFDFDLSDPLLEFLRLGQSGRLKVISCLGCDLPYAGQLYYRTSDRDVEILRNEGSTPFQPWDTALPRSAVLLAPVPPEQRRDSFSSEDEWREAVEFSEIPLHPLGGSPFWVQDEIDVPCCECTSRMRLLGQVASETWPVGDTDLLAGHMFGDMGMIYIHFCDSCRVLATGGSCY